MKEILCIIPARSGSKGIKDKNIKLFNGKPLISYTIEQALQCSYKMKIIVSTDSIKYKEIALKYGAEVPFLRPISISQDNSKDIDFIKHSVNFLKKEYNYYPDIIVQLRITQPLRKVEDINCAVKFFIDNFEKYDSLRSVVEFEKSAFKMYTINYDNNNYKILKPILKVYNDIYEPFNEGRQYLPKTYLHNGYIDIIKTSILYNNTISGDKIYPYIMNKHEIIDIDNMDDWNKALLFSQSTFFKFFSFKLFSWSRFILNCFLNFFNSFY